ncbi:hypothetical protein HBH98_187400 [Parastagonospora nodorum]|nr:hypothetical protein HBH51_159020 [Parastagonospora nodorum]KAH3981200.1 hypothetical protein HBH52_086540 [Parastagonospora nodorum]KAH4022705.1 hypothetical protein HBI09_166550 [Parastagonospora nodorum]KAH4070244.1 hypothetical protein HBH50_096240 [Parastagonospora nodorum]KAH4090809.1 hypothetical protein HBH48_100010 [Parastagonospora nodorum]
MSSSLRSCGGRDGTIIRNSFSRLSALLDLPLGFLDGLFDHCPLLVHVVVLLAMLSLSHRNVLLQLLVPLVKSSIVHPLVQLELPPMMIFGSFDELIYRFWGRTVLTQSYVLSLRLRRTCNNRGFARVERAKGDTESMVEDGAEVSHGSESKQ